MKWGGAVLSVVLVTVWIGSGWWYAAYTWRGGAEVDVAVGLVIVGQADPAMNWPLPGWDVGPRELSYDWWFHGSADRSADLSWWWFGTPLWLPTASLLLATAAAWRLDAIARRRARAGCCAKCGYDLRGLRDGVVCPECGAAAASAPRAGA